VSHGDGASYQGPDEGQYGTGPRCIDDPKYPGAFRAQSPNKINGKIMRVNPNNPRDLQVRVVACRSNLALERLHRRLPCVAVCGVCRGRQLPVDTPGNEELDAATPTLGARTLSLHTPSLRTSLCCPRGQP